MSIGRLVAAGGLLVLAGCGGGATLPPIAQLSCTAEAETGSPYGHLEARIEDGHEVRYQVTVDYGDGAQEMTLIYGGGSRRFSHLYQANGSYVIQASARNEETNDRLTCTRTVEFDICRSPSIYGEDFEGGPPDVFWRHEVVSDSSTIRQARDWRGSGGNPGGYQVLTHEFTATTAPSFVSIFVYHLNTFGGADQGPIDRIRYREDRIKLAPTTATSAVGSGAVILQNGIYHVAPLSGGQFSNQGWERVTAVLRASDFTPPPDFSAHASPMLFGYMRSNSNRFPLLIEHGIDNWRVELCRPISP